MTTCAKCGEDLADPFTDCQNPPLCALRVELREAQTKCKEWKALAINRRVLFERNETAWEAALEERDTELRNLRVAVLLLAQEMDCGAKNYRGATDAGAPAVWAWGRRLRKLAGT